MQVTTTNLTAALSKALVDKIALNIGGKHFNVLIWNSDNKPDHTMTLSDFRASLDVAKKYETIGLTQYKKPKYWLQAYATHVPESMPDAPKNSVLMPVTLMTARDIKQYVNSLLESALLNLSTETDVFNLHPISNRIVWTHLTGTGDGWRAAIVKHITVMFDTDTPTFSRLRLRGVDQSDSARIIRAPFGFTVDTLTQALRHVLLESN